MKLMLSWLKDHLQILLALAAGTFVLAAPTEHMLFGILVIFLIQVLQALWSALVAILAASRLVYRLVLPRQRATR